MQKKQQIYFVHGLSFRPFYPQMTAESVLEVLKNHEKYAKECSLEGIRENIYFTIGYHDTLSEGQHRSGKSWSGQDCTAFDYEGIDLSREYEYRVAAAKANCAPLQALSIVSSGHGQHVYVHHKKYKDKDEFFSPVRKAAYKHICEKINDEFTKAGLPYSKKDTKGSSDMVFDFGRILRLPGTINKKPERDPKPCTLLQLGYEIDYDLLQASGVTSRKERPNDRITPREMVYYQKVLDVPAILEECNYVAQYSKNPSLLHHDEWYAIAGIIGYNDIGKKELALMARGATASPTLSSYTEEKLSSEIARATVYPGHTCEFIFKEAPEKCQSCKHFGKIRSPHKIVGPNSIPTKDTGFRLLPAPNSKFGIGKIDRDSLRKYFEHERGPYVTTEHKTDVWIWNGSFYTQDFTKSVESWAHKLIHPEPEPHEISTLSHSFHMNGYRGSKWFFDSTKDKLNFRNGVLNTLTGEFEPQPTGAKNPEYGFRYELNIEYNPHAECPVWDNYCEAVFRGSKEPLKNQIFLEEQLGYALSGDKPWAQTALILKGQPSSGKSTLIKLLEFIAPQESRASLSADLLDEPNHIVQLEGKLFSVSSETPKKAFLASQNFLKIITADTLVGKKLYQDMFNFTTYCKLIFAAYELPYIGASDMAYFRRIQLVCFRNKFDPKAGVGDFNFEEKLFAEAAGIFNRVRQRYAEVIKRRDSGAKEAFSVPIDSIEELNLYKDSNNPIAEYTETKLMVDKDNASGVKGIDIASLRSAYIVWARSMGKFDRFDADKIAALVADKLNVSVVFDSGDKCRRVSGVYLAEHHGNPKLSDRPYSSGFTPETHEF